MSKEIQLPSSTGTRVDNCDTKSSQIITCEFKGINYQVGVYNPGFWNIDGDEKYKEVNNCYAYACNIRVRSVISSTERNMPQPDSCSTGNKKPEGTKEFLAGIKKDGLVSVQDIIDRKAIAPEGSIEHPVWLCAMVYASTLDHSDSSWSYHCYRQVWDGNDKNTVFWAHKMGAGNVERLAKAVNIEKYKTKGFDNFIGYYLVPPRVMFCITETIRVGR
ncbi:hypothetical protein GPY51_00005 [Photorhabdus laumondii subsp. laumondii]|uniref:Uncharacterized protein n=1 Tax=Photorhabdus laumondii subsp. laumondii TaxID=141679 RepID=A0A6L9JHR2_PHOLM|nr:MULTISPECIES: hypothetical protein [Photorhabdus]KTL61591.1 hypothetical protein AA106_22840 [Photorhabdus laumondii subsp. laumondii]MCC8386576.1 hypothetical protein [Photorhabdus laumondii]MCC8412523.1 hypothetical protein [Photorhabdus laumondii]NDK92925.1 hypothetical protein [Photorhabdus laumondii subsp. laumondii]NDL19058.1 hypothetical protein [Photorhabdus laumondii subsp. laumondii]